MNSDQKIITMKILKQNLDSLKLINASLDEYQPFKSGKKYSPKEREPYDALCDRFIRVVEISLKFFRSYEKLVEGANSETIRDLLHKMVKFGFISSTELWLNMRDVRNRVVHDYLPEDVARIYTSITGEFGGELNNLKIKLENAAI